MKKILDINVDKEFGTTDVSISVPQFDNFGQRLGELKRKASEALLAQPEPESDPEFEAEIEEDLNKLFESVKKSVNLMKKDLESQTDSSQKKMMKQMIEQFSKIDEKPDEEDDAEEGDAVKANEDRFNYDLQKLRVVLEEEMKWDKSTEATFDKFLSDWPSIRPAVLQATFKHYKKMYRELMEIFGDSAGSEFSLPKPTDAEIVADLFTITAIYLRDDGSIGLGGHCTWDDEHGYGALIKNKKVVVVGHESDAFS